MKSNVASHLKNLTVPELRLKLRLASFRHNFVAVAAIKHAINVKLARS